MSIGLPRTAPVRTLVVVGLAALPAVLVLGDEGFLLMLARSFMRQWALVVLVLVVLFAWRRQWFEAAAAMGATIVVALQVPWLPAGPEVPATAQQALRVAQFNVLQPNRSNIGVLDAVHASDADVLSFQEVDPAWATILTCALAEAYPFHRVVPRTDCYGIAVFSRLPIVHFEEVDLLGAPAIEARVKTPSGIVTLTSVHARSPLPHVAYLKRNAQLNRLASRILKASGPQVVVGDLNAVEWDHALVRFRQQTGLAGAPAYEPATFPSVFGLALIPIDHIYSTKQLRVGATTTKHLPGSDHKALVADLHWNER
ncbi:MAG: endonuclease/exonuclease/phosphatase family protein [Flavobacteriales bacterium]|nr:MAG: endonuclease/exonuclease/phosphatase family protein [Flavobacteriales bacterium]